MERELNELSNQRDENSALLYEFLIMITTIKKNFREETVHNSSHCSIKSKATDLSASGLTQIVVKCLY